MRARVCAHCAPDAVPQKPGLGSSHTRTPPARRWPSDSNAPRWGPGHAERGGPAWPQTCRRLPAMGLSMSDSSDCQRKGRAEGLPEIPREVGPWLSGLESTPKQNRPLWVPRSFAASDPVPCSLFAHPTPQRETLFFFFFQTKPRQKPFFPGRVRDIAVELRRCLGKAGRPLRSLTSLSPARLRGTCGWPGG